MKTTRRKSAEKWQHPVTATTGVLIRNAGQQPQMLACLANRFTKPAPFGMLNRGYALLVGRFNAPRSFRSLTSTIKDASGIADEVLGLSLVAQPPQGDASR